jgi:DNA-binding response OmpR family regulator
MLELFKAKKESKRAKILVVDDEPDCLSTIKYRLNHSGYEVVTATDGQEGFKIAQQESPDLILLDTNMPIMNGREMLKCLRKHPALKDTPVIMVTACCEVQDIAVASSYGISGYIAKPFDFTDLMEKIQNALEHKKTLSKA